MLADGQKKRGAQFFLDPQLKGSEFASLSEICGRQSANYKELA